MNFALFLMLNAIMFVRPAELVPAFATWPIYQALIVLCLLVSLEPVGKQLHSMLTGGHALSWCVLAFGVACVLSHLAHGATWEARMQAAEFGKILAYYLLLLALVDTTKRLRLFLFWLFGCIAVLALLAVLQYHGIAELPGISVTTQKVFDPEEGEWRPLQRLSGSGVFSDPNDMCLALVLGCMIGLYLLGDGNLGRGRLAVVGVLVFFAYVFQPTHSRGGLLALMAALVVLLWVRNRSWKTPALALGCGLPAVLVLLAGRQTEFALTSTDDTGQMRIQLWAQGLNLFRESPLFGIGTGRCAEEIGHVAHNSFVHGFVETGFLGGCFFLGMFVFSLWPLERLAPEREAVADLELQRLLPYLCGAVAGYAVGLLSLSRNYIVPTYLVVGLAHIYLRQVSEYTPPMAQRLSAGLMARLLVGGVLTLAVFYVVVRLLARWHS